MTRNSLGIADNDREWVLRSHPLPARLATEGIVVCDAQALRVWIRESFDSDLTRDFLDLTPHRLSDSLKDVNFLIGDGPPQEGQTTLADLVNGESWFRTRNSLDPVGSAIPPREDEGPVQVWQRMLGQVTLHSARIEIVDRYLFNNFKNFPNGESPLERILSECLNGYSGEVRFHCGRLEEVPFSYENAVRRLFEALPKLASGRTPRFSFRLCSAGSRERTFSHDRWIYFSFTGGPGVMYSLGKGIEDIHGKFEVRSLSEHPAPGDWTRIDAQTKYLEDLAASNRLNQMLTQRYS